MSREEIVKEFLVKMKDILQRYTFMPVNDDTVCALRSDLDKLRHEFASQYDIHLCDFNIIADTIKNIITVSSPEVVDPITKIATPLVNTDI